ncbi:hypothetical protein [Elizabethkingia anophelis]
MVNMGVVVEKQIIGDNMKEYGDLILAYQEALHIEKKKLWLSTRL